MADSSHKRGNQRQVLPILTLKLHGAQRQSPELITIQNHEGNKQIIPTDNHRQRRDGCQRGPARWKQDAPEEIKVVTAIDVRSVLQFAGMAVKKPRRIRILPDILNAICTRMTPHKAVDHFYAHLIHLAQYEIDRQNRNVDGKHQTQGKQVEKPILAPELHACKNKSSQAANKDDTGGGRQP